MLDINSQYVNNYLMTIESLGDDLFNQDYSSVSEMGVRIINDKDKDWKYRIIKDIDSTVNLRNFCSNKLKEFIFDNNILDVTIHSIPPQHFIHPHIDDKAHDRNVWRVLYPIQSDNFVLRRSGKSDILEIGKPYIIDYTYEVHSSYNLSKTKNFVAWIFDIFYEDNSMHKNKIITGIGLSYGSKMEEIDNYFMGSFY